MFLKSCKEHRQKGKTQNTDRVWAQMASRTAGPGPRALRWLLPAMSAQGSCSAPHADLYR